MKIFTLIPSTAQLTEGVTIDSFIEKGRKQHGVLIGYYYHDYLAPKARYFYIRPLPHNKFVDYVNIVPHKTMSRIFSARQCESYTETDKVCVYIKSLDVRDNVRVVDAKSYVNDGRLMEGATITDSLDFKSACRMRQVTYDGILILKINEPVAIRYVPSDSKYTHNLIITWTGETILMEKVCRYKRKKQHGHTK